MFPILGGKRSNASYRHSKWNSPGPKCPNSRCQHSSWTRYRSVSRCAGLVLVPHCSVSLSSGRRYHACSPLVENIPVTLTPVEGQYTKCNEQELTMPVGILDKNPTHRLGSVSSMVGQLPYRDYISCRMERRAANRSINLRRT